MKYAFNHSLSLTAAALILTINGPALGQDAPETGGMTMTFGIQTGLKFNDNYTLNPTTKEPATVLNTKLSFRLASETPLDSFVLEADGVLRAAKRPIGTETQFADPHLRLSYGRTGARSKLNLEAEWQHADLDFLDPFDITEISDPSDLTSAIGQREIRRGRLIYETGIDAPFGFLFELGTERESYTDTVDPELYDQSTTDAAVTARMRFSPVAEGRLRFSEEVYRAKDISQTDRRTREAEFGVTYALSPIDTLDFSFGQTEVRNTLGAVPSTTKDKGFVGSVGLTRELANGSAGILLDRNFSVSGSRTTLSVRRAIDLPSGQLAASFGVTKGEVGGTELIGSLDYLHEMPRGRITARLDRSVDNGSDGTDILTTRANLGYLMELSPVSSLTFELDYAEIGNTGGGTAEEVKRLGARVTYLHSLTEDWNLMVGFAHLRRDSSIDSTSDANMVFVTLGRDFVFRP